MASPAVADGTATLMTDQLGGAHDGLFSLIFALFPRLIVCAVSALVCIRVCVWLRTRSLLPSLVSRKLMHLITGPCFCSLWLLFPTDDSARYSRQLVALIPLCSALYFMLVGLGVVFDAGLVSAVSRSGERSELCRGPFLYGVLHWLACWWYWTECAVGVQLLCILCVGDGLADVLGRWATQRGVNSPLPWNAGKSVLGSASMLVGSLLSCGVLLALYKACGLLSKESVGKLTWSTVVLSIVTTAVESLPLSDVDNVTVFAAGALTSYTLRLC